MSLFTHGGSGILNYMKLLNKDRSHLKFKIGYRTAKTAVGVSLVILTAQLLHLQFYVSSAIITILCIQTSKKKSLQSSSSRFIACMLAILFSYIFFEGIGYHPFVIGLMLLFFIPITVMTKSQEGVVTSSVITLHIYSVQHMTWDLVWNEVSLVIIGIGIALLVNIYMPSLDKQMTLYQQQIEINFKSILNEMTTYLRTNESDWSGKEIIETGDIINKAKSLAFRDIENHFLRTRNYYYHYFSIRQKQLDIIERLLPLVTSIKPMCEQRFMIAAFLEELSCSIHPGNTANVFLRKLGILEQEFMNMPLPETREDFKAEAQLLQLIKELREYLIIKDALVIEE